MKELAFEWMSPVKVVYTNYRGETSVRNIRPRAMRFGTSEYHPEPQWLVEAFDLDKNARREFALKDMKPAD